MNGWSFWLWFLILCLQNLKHVWGTHSQEINDVTVSTQESFQKTTATPSASHQQPIRQSDDGPRTVHGIEQVNKALIFLHKYEQQNPRPSLKPKGILGVAGQYLQTLVPRFYINGPPSENLHSSKKYPEQQGDAIALLEEAAMLDNPDAIFLLAEMNFYGNFSHPRNFTEASKRYHQLASLNGNSSAQHMIGFIYSTGIGRAVERDQARALLYHTFAARGGNVRSEMTLAFRHHSGIGVATNCDNAVKHYKNVADKAIDWFRLGNIGGMAWVSESYRLADEEGGVYGEGASFSSSGSSRKNHGVHSDAYAALDDVLEYLDLMSRKGDYKATFSLGRIHYDGQKRHPRNPKMAKRYFMRVAKLYWQRDGRVIENDSPGLEKIATKTAGYLGRMFLRGEGVEQSFEKAQVWFQRGIKSGDAGSQWGMGLILLEGLGVQKNTARAVEYFKAAADQDYAPAQVSLGMLYLDQGTSSDVRIASYYFELAARYGHIEAFYFLAELAEQGIGRDRNCPLAVAYYKNVAEKAEPLLSSFSEASKAFEQGDYELALIDYMHTAEQGWEKGQANVAFLLDDQKSQLQLPSWLSLSAPRPESVKDQLLALIYWTRSAKQSNIDSLIKMGDYYLAGIGTPPDTEKAASCYTAASDYHNSAMASYNLAWMHENGIGLNQDFHLAKRYYDLALETNEEAYLPVIMSLFKLRIRSAWNTLTNGRVNSIHDEPVIKKQRSISDWINNFLHEEENSHGERDYEDTFPSDNRPILGRDADGLYDDIIEDGYLESFIIVGLCAALVFLVWYRQQRRQAHQGNQGDRAADGQNRPAAVQEDRGLFPQRQDPEFAQWVAGGVGH